MNSSELVVFITSLSIVIADQFPNNDELGLLATSLNQLGDTLTTIATQRELQESRNTPSEEETLLQA